MILNYKYKQVLDRNKIVNMCIPHLKPNMLQLIRWWGNTEAKICYKERMCRVGQKNWTILDVYKSRTG